MAAALRGASALRKLAGALVGGARRADGVAFKGVLSRLSPRRQIIHLYGSDTNKFLNGMVSQKVMSTEEANEELVGAVALNAPFLNPRGRVLYDTILYYRPQTHSWWLECDSSATTMVMEHLRKYKLRYQVHMEPEAARAYDVYALLGTDEASHKALTLHIINTTGTQDFQLYVDPRWPLAYRLIAPRDTIPLSHLIHGIPRSTASSSSSSSSTSTQTRQGRSGPPAPGSSSVFWDPSAQVYDWLRTLNGISEGGSELGHETTIPLEANMDYFSGIDFHKGCYLGQELVARTYHQGQVRKRMLPFISTPYTTDELQRNPELRSTLEQLSLKASPGLILPEYILSPELGWDTTSAADGAAINDAAPLQSIYNANGPNPTPTPSQTQPGVVVPRARASTGPGSVIRTHPAFQTGIAMMRLDHVLPPAIANATTTATTENDATPSTQQQQQQQQPQQQQPRPATLFAVGTKVVKLVLPLWWDQYYTSQLEALGDGVASPDSVHTRPASVEP